MTDRTSREDLMAIEPFLGESKRAGPDAVTAWASARFLPRNAYPITRHMMNPGRVFTTEGTHDLHTLTLGRALTGLNTLHCHE